MSTRVFVYGSLLSGERNHHVLAEHQARRVGEARTEPRFSLFDMGAYPGMAEGGTDAVVGEVYEVDADTLAVLDRFEGHPDLYRRTRITLEGGREAEAYLVARARARGHALVAHGDWRTHLATR